MKNFLTALTSSFTCKEQGEGIALSTPIMYQGADHTFSFYIESCGSGFRINDRGQTLDYMRENFNPDRYSDEISAVCERFEIELTDGVFYGRLGSYESGQTMRNLHTFIGAMNIIANIDLF